MDGLPEDPKTKSNAKTKIGDQLSAYLESEVPDDFLPLFPSNPGQPPEFSQALRERIAGCLPSWVEKGERELRALVKARKPIPNAEDYLFPVGPNDESLLSLDEIEATMRELLVHDSKAVRACIAKQARLAIQGNDSFKASVYRRYLELARETQTQQAWVIV
ncbi:hypothetical protein VDG1235_3804 [Verrucomicrobiia bacterium DG1235]|nr:hypothetical protein VDG1235_3804 [Verrucomicrobiae bacterium DG1235]